jgi:hypothetical protein
MATILPAHQIAVVNLYTALFNRAPDAAGLTFWAQALADGAPLANITQSFMGTTEGRATYPVAQTSAQFVASFYQTVFGRAADTGGLAFWTAALDAAGGAGSDAARAALAGQIVGVVNQPLVGKPEGLSDAAYAQTVADRALFANKAVVGDYVASLNINDVVLARKVLALVTQDPGSIPIAKAFAANGGITPAPPEPPAPPAIVFLVTNADSEADIILKFASYTGTTAAVETTGMDAAKLSAVAGGVVKIGSGGIHGRLAVDVPGYAGATLATLAPKLATDATLIVTGSNAVDTITLKEFQRGTNVYALDGDDIFIAVVDATTPANTTLSARHGLVGGAGTDTLRIEVTGTGVNALNGAALVSIETLQMFVSGSATLAANAAVSKVVVVGPLPPAPSPTPEGSLTVSGLAAGATLVLDHTTSASSFRANYAAGATVAQVTMDNNAFANVLALSGIDVTSASLSSSVSAAGITTLDLASGINTLTINSTDGIGITALSGGAASGVAVTVSGPMVIGFLAVNTVVTTFDASGSTGQFAANFLAPVQEVKGGSGTNYIQISSHATLIGGTGADIFVLHASVGLGSTADAAALMGRTVTVNNFVAGDQIQLAADIGAGGALLPVQAVALSSPASLGDAVSQLLAAPALGTASYLRFAYGADSYVFFDNNRDGLGAGDMLIKLTGITSPSTVNYQDGVLSL